jgi:hypothetical protein
MKLAPFPQPFPAPQEVVVNPKTGAFDLTTGRKFFEALWNRTGAGDGIIPSIATGLIATGNSLVTALDLTDDWNEVDIVAAGAGVQIPPLSPGQQILIFNGGGNALKIYPFGGGVIDGLAINAAYSLGVGKLQIISVWTLTQLRTFGALQIP